MAEEIHKHYYMWPEDKSGNCSGFSCMAVGVVCALIVLLAWMDKLPW